MNWKLLIYVLIFAVSVFISSVSQVMLKKAALKEYKSLIEEYTNPLIISAYAIFFLSSIMTILAYKEVPLSMGPIIEATSYLYVSYFGARFFGEKVSARKIVALILIVCGIIVFAVLG